MLHGLRCWHLMRQQPIVWAREDFMWRKTAFNLCDKKKKPKKNPTTFKESPNICFMFLRKMPLSPETTDMERTLWCSADSLYHPDSHVGGSVTSDAPLLLPHGGWTCDYRDTESHDRLLCRLEFTTTHWPETQNLTLAVHAQFCARAEKIFWLQSLFFFSSKIC